MSVNPDGMDSVDYSDFEYQTNQIQLTAQEQEDATGGGNVFVRSVNQVEPLDGIGGLDNNEVAELVYLEVIADIEYVDDSADQDVSTSGYIQGVVGANLSPSEDSFPVLRNSSGTSTIVQVNEIDESNVSTLVRGGSEDRWFQPFRAGGSAPFDDQTNGPGGGASQDHYHSEKNFRNMVGRGPVLDSSDDVSVAVEVSTDDTVLDFTGDVTIHMVWDVAETSDAGRAFSVPMD